MAPLAAAAPDLSQHDVDLTVGLDDLFMMLIVFTGVCLAVLVTFAVAALWATRLEHSAEEVDQEHPEERVTGLRSPAAPGLPRKHLAVPPAGNSVRRLPPPAPAAPSSRGYRTVPLSRSVVRRVASPAPAAPSSRGYRTVPLSRSVVRRLASPAPAAPSSRGYRTVPLPRSVVGRLASPAPAAPSSRGYRTVPLPRSVVGRLASPPPAVPSPRGYHTAPLPHQVLEALKTYTKHCFAGQRAAGHR